MSNIGFNLNRGLIRQFTFANLPPRSVPTVVSSGIKSFSSLQDHLKTYVQTVGANTIAKQQRLAISNYDNNDTVLSSNASGTIQLSAGENIQLSHAESSNTFNFAISTLNLNTVDSNITSIENLTIA